MWNEHQKTELWTSQTLEDWTLNTFEHPIWAQYRTSNLTNITKTELFANFIIKKWAQNFPNLQNWTSNMSEQLILAKTELRTSRTSPKTKQFTNIELFVPPLILIHSVESIKAFWFTNTSELGSNRSC